MNPQVERIEVYVDDATEPVQVLTQPPFKVRLDTRTLPDGEHALRIVTVFKSGAKEERRLTFFVDNLPDVALEGLDEDQRVSGEVEFDVKVGEYQAPIEPGRTSPWLYIVATVVVLFLVWLFFAVSPTSEEIASQMAPSGGAAEESVAQGSGAPVDQALFDKGKDIYAQSCAACHQAGGEGVPGAFPALKGNKLLGDLKGTLTIITEGKGGMPAFKDFSDEDLAALLTYIRNDFGNSFGGVSVDDVKEALGKGGSTAEAGGGEALAALIKTGEEVYAQNCAACHQAGGEGIPGAFPALKGNQNMKDKKLVIDRILNGAGAMPPFGSSLDDAQVAAVATYLRAKLNDFGPVSESDVKAER